MFCKFLSMMVSISIAFPFDTVRNWRWSWCVTFFKDRPKDPPANNGRAVKNWFAKFSYSAGVLFAGGSCPKEFYASTPPPTSHCVDSKTTTASCVPTSSSYPCLGCSFSLEPTRSVVSITSMAEMVEMAAPPLGSRPLYAASWISKVELQWQWCGLVARTDIKTWC